MQVWHNLYRCWNGTYTNWSLVLLKNASDEIDVSLVFVTVLLVTETWSHTLRFMLHTSIKKHAVYLQVPEVDVVPETVIVDFKQSVLIGYVSVRQNSNNNSEIDQKMKLLASKGWTEYWGHALCYTNDGEVGSAGFIQKNCLNEGKRKSPKF